MKKSMIIVFMCCLAVFALANIKDEKTTKKLEITSSMEYPNFEDIDNLSDAASDIIQYRIVDSRFENIDIRIDKSRDNDETFENDFQNLYTVYTVIVDDVYKGNFSVGEKVEIKQLGGENDQVTFISDGHVDLSEEYNYVLFLQSYEDIPASILNPIQSAYIYNNIQSRSVAGNLSSVNSKNNLAFTYGDLMSIKEDNE